MDIEVRNIKGYKILDLMGRADDLPAINQVQKAVEAAIEESDLNCVINLQKAEYISSGLVGLIVHWFKMFQDRGKLFYLIEPNDSSRKILELVGIHKLITIYASEKDFLAENNLA